MTDDSSDWLKGGEGRRPELGWSVAADAPLSAMELAGETGEVLAADTSGGIYLLNRRGAIAALTRGPEAVHALGWSDTGRHFAAALGEATLSLINRKLKAVWSLELPEPILAVAITPHGSHIAVSLTNGMNLILDEYRRRVAHFRTNRPLRFLRFLTSKPILIGLAEHGLLGAYRLDGSERWSARLWSSAGDLSVTGDGSVLLVAGFSHGVQLFDGQGETRGAYAVEGTANHVSTSYMPRRVAATTLERHFYWLDTTGRLIWGGELPEDAAVVRCDPLGSGAVCGLRSGKMVRLDWKI